MELSLTSTAFESGQDIPARYTADGANISPPLYWSGVPPGTRSLALIVDDPDAPDPAAPRRTWVHWLVFNIPPDSSGFPEGAYGQDLPSGCRQGLNDWRDNHYGGPCPPIGRHRYIHQLYALDSVLPHLERPDKAQLAQAMRGHIIEQAELIGMYQRQ
ncbi:Raf kinase inhibitor-like YbhB/YbcL family protein [Oxalobacteraceae bacterium GrIS 1.11]